MMRYVLPLAVVAALVLAGIVVMTPGGAREVRLASPTATVEPTPPPENAAERTVVPGLAGRPDVPYEEVPGTPRPSDGARAEAASMLAHARLMMGLGTEDPVDSYALHLTSQHEADPVARAVLEQATQAWCRGAFPVAYAALSRLADEPPVDYDGMEEWEQALRADPIERVIDRWRAGDFYAPAALRHMEDRERWLDRRAQFGVNDEAAHCEHQGSFEAWAAAQG